MKYTLEDLIKSINESSFSKEDKIYIETVANLAYAIGAKDMDEKLLEKMEKEQKEELPAELINESFAENL